MRKLTPIVILLLCNIIHAHAQYVPHNGDIDSTFGVNGVIIITTDQYPSGFVVLPNDELITMANTGTTDEGLIRLTRNGQPDTTFGISGVKVTDTSSSNQLFHATFNYVNGKILALAEGDYLAPLLCRYLPDGALDSTFNKNGYDSCPINTPYVLVTVQADGKYILAGTEDAPIPRAPYRSMLMRYNEDGSIDSGFCACGTGTAVVPVLDASTPSAVGVQADGKILLAGGTVGYPNYTVFLFRYNINGTIDMTFGNGGSVVPDCMITAMKVLPDGKILAAGNNADYDGFIMERFNSDGTLDHSFATNGVANVSYYKNSGGIIGSQNARIAIQANGKIILTGNSWPNSAGTEDVAMMLRFSAAGIVDSSFGINGVVLPQSLCVLPECDNNINYMDLQANGDIIIMQNIYYNQTALRRYIGHLADTIISGAAPVISVYPNPSSGKYTISATNLKSIAVMTVCDVVGRKLLTVQHDFSTSATTQVNITHLPTGIYFLRVMPLRRSAKVVKLLKE